MDKTPEAELMAAVPEEVGIGWYEWFTSPETTTHIAYLYESGRIYLPEFQVTKQQFLNALSTGKAFRLYRLDELEEHSAETPD